MNLLLLRMQKEIDKVGIVARQFSLIFNRVVALDWCFNFISA